MSFNLYDVDGDGFLSRAEFQRFEQHAFEVTNATFSIEPTSSDRVLGFWPAFFNSLLMIWATEIGDKTFFIAAILAMRNPPIVVFTGALSALAVMTVLSAAMGFALPNLIPRKYTHYLAAALFVYFGGKLIYDAQGMEAGAPSEELEEVEEELATTEAAAGVDPGLPIAVSVGVGADDSSGKSKRKGVEAHVKIWWQSFTLTFLAEWGDRSQIATIALAAAKDPYGVTAGGVLGHAMCTGLAVVGGRVLASKISEKSITYFGGVLFLLFALHSLVVGVG